MGDLGVFLAAALLLLVTPGPAVLYIVARSVDQGRAAGLVSALGVHAGTLMHVAAAAAGLSVLLAASATLFSVVKYLGAAYLIFLGVRRLLDRTPLGGPAARAIPWRRAFLDGAIVNVLNPKTALFCLAFLPQFVDPTRGHVGPQVLALGLVFVMLGLVTDGLYAIAAGSARRWNRAASPRFMTGQRWVTRVMYIGLGVAAAFSDARAETVVPGSPGRSALWRAAGPAAPRLREQVPVRSARAGARSSAIIPRRERGDDAATADERAWPVRGMPDRCRPARRVVPAERRREWSGAVSGVEGLGERVGERGRSRCAEARRGGERESVASRRQTVARRGRSN